MTLKKMLLLAGMALAALVFAAPAAAQAAAYWTHGEHGATVGNGQGNGTDVTVQHNIISSAGGLNASANIHLEGEVWNNPGTEMGEGVITGHTATDGTIVGVPPAFGCSVSVSLGEAEWPLALTTDKDPGATETDATLDIENFTIRNIYNAKCQELGAPRVTAATGTIELTASSNGEHTDLTFEPGPQPGLTIYNPSTGAHISPSPAIAYSSEGTALTLEGLEGPIGVQQ